MYRNNYNYNQNEERFLGPVIPFLGGALIGYVASRPNFNTSYVQPYYPVYYNYPPYEPYPYYSLNNSYQQPSRYNIN